MLRVRFVHVVTIALVLGGELLAAGHGQRVVARRTSGSCNMGQLTPPTGAGVGDD
jgi:hypothetical protein